MLRAIDFTSSKQFKVRPQAVHGSWHGMDGHHSSESLSGAAHTMGESGGREEGWGGGVFSMWHRVSISRFPPQGRLWHQTGGFGIPLCEKLITAGLWYWASAGWEVDGKAFVLLLTDWTRLCEAGVTDQKRKNPEAWQLLFKDTLKLTRVLKNFQKHQPSVAGYWQLCGVSILQSTIYSGTPLSRRDIAKWIAKTVDGNRIESEKNIHAFLFTVYHSTSS